MMNSSGLECEGCLFYFKGIKGERGWIQKICMNKNKIFYYKIIYNKNVIKNYIINNYILNLILEQFSNFRS